jgi:hypothetical protein
MPKPHEPARIRVGISPEGARDFKERLRGDSEFYDRLRADPRGTLALYGVDIPASVEVDTETFPSQQELSQGLEQLQMTGLESGSTMMFLHPIIWIIWALAANTEEYGEQFDAS